MLDLIEKNKVITQRYMSDYLNISVSMVNKYLGEHERNGYVIRKYTNSKTVTYIITQIGIEYRKLLNIQ